MSTGRGCRSRSGGGFLAKGKLESNSLFVIIYYNIF